MSEVKEVKEDKELTALIAKNRALKKELEKLKRLEQEAESKTASKGVVDVKAIKAAFDSIDTDKSGFVDRDEFAALSADLGELLDEEELSAAIKQIDTSGDGKISFNEFVRWWEESSKQPKKEKKKSKLFILKAKLKAKYLGQQASKFLATLAKTKGANSAPEEKDLQTHHWRIALGEMKEPGAYVHVAVNFKPLEEKSMPEVCHSVVTFKASVKSEADAKTLKTLADIALADKAEGLYELNHDAKTMNLKVYVPEPDPFPDMKELKLDLSQYIPELGAKLELAKPLRAVFADPNSSAAPEVTDPFELLKLNFEINAKLRKTFIPALVQAMPEQGDLAFANLLEKTNVELGLGEVKTLMEPILAQARASGGITQMIPEAMLQDTRNPLSQILPMVAGMIDGFAADNGEMVMSLLQRLPKKAAKPLLKNKSTQKIVEVVAQALGDLEEITLHTESGVRVTMSFNGMLPFDRLPTKL